MRRQFSLIVVAIVTFLAAATPVSAGLLAGPWAQLAGDRAVAIAWEASGGPTDVQWGTDPAHLDRTVTATSAADHIFRAVLADLPPHTKIFYRVKEGASGDFVTPGGPGDSFVFTAYGDTRSRPSDHAKVVAAMLRENPALVAHTGDFVAASNAGQWRGFFATAGSLLRSAILLPTIGNHEAYFMGNGRDDPKFASLFEAPGRPGEAPSRRVVQYDGVRFIVLDNTVPCDAGSPQYAWLKEQLAAAAASPDVKFLVAQMHYPPYSVGLHHKDADVVQFRETAAPLFKTYGVDLVLSGHDHNYQHALVDGVHYLTLGGGGAPLYSQFDMQPWVLSARAVLSYARIEASPTQLRVIAKEPDGKVIEEFAIGRRERRAAP